MGIPMDGSSRTDLHWRQISILHDGNEMNKIHEDRLSRLTFQSLCGLTISLFSFALLHSCGCQVALALLCAPSLLLFILIACFVPCRYLFPDWNMILIVSTFQILLVNGLCWAIRYNGDRPISTKIRMFKCFFLFFAIFAFTSIVGSDMTTNLGFFGWGWIGAIPGCDHFSVIWFDAASFVGEIILDVALLLAISRLIAYQRKR